MKSSDKETVDIRRMARGDIDAVLAIDRKIGGGRGLITYRDMVAVDPGGQLDLSFVAQVDKKVVGFVLSRITYVGVPFIEIALLQALGVDPDYQRRGIASKLVNALLERCHAEGVSTVRAVVGERDTEIRRFFERLGFHHSRLINYTRTFEG